MLFIAISLPLGVLCLYLGFLSWDKNQRVSAALLSFAMLNFVLALGSAAIVFFLSQHLGLL